MASPCRLPDDNLVNFSIQNYPKQKQQRVMLRGNGPQRFRGVDKEMVVYDPFSSIFIKEKCICDIRFL